MRTLALFLLTALACKADFACASHWGNAYSYCKAITQFHATVAGADQPDFRMFIAGTDTDLKTVGNGGFVQSASGFDIIFTSDQQGTVPISFERATWSATTGLYAFWFKRSLSATVDTPIYMFFGNAAIMSDQQSLSGTWGSSYAGVYHFGDGTTLSLADSSGNGNDGTNHSATACAGQVLGGACFTQAGSQFIDIGNNSSLELTAAITIESWAKYTGTVPLDSTHFPVIVNNISSAGQNGYGLLLHGDSGGGETSQLYFQTATGGFFRPLTSAEVIVQNTIYSVAATYDSSVVGNNAFLYINTGNRQNDFGTSAIGASTQAVTISQGQTAGQTQFWNGFLDEIRISNVARTAGWIFTGYNNANDPSTFYSISAKVQNSPGGGGLRLYIFR